MLAKSLRLHAQRLLLAASLSQVFVFTACRESSTGGSELASASSDASKKALADFKAYIQQKKTIADNTDLAFLKVSLTDKDAQAAKDFLWGEIQKNEKAARQKEIDSKTVTASGVTMKYETREYGKKPSCGHSLYISLHGGGSVSAEENDQQWRNQIDLYKPAEGIYLAPRAPSDSWDMWHKEPMDQLIERLIANYVITGQVDPDKVYIMGYSAGGDGVYQLAPRLADHFAAASMSAGHPGDASPLNLRNIGFTLFVGSQDSAYDRNKLVSDWNQKLNELAKADKGAYQHLFGEPNTGHWMDGQESVIVPWIAKFKRSSTPSKVVWRQDDTTKQRFYWLNAKNPKAGETVTATISGQKITLEGTVSGGLSLRLADNMLKYDKDIEVVYNGKSIAKGKPCRELRVIYKSMMERMDPSAVYNAEIQVK